MPLKLISPGGGSVILSSPTTASTYTLTVPAVTANVITDTADSVTNSMILNGSVTTAKINDSAITTAKINDAAITAAKMGYSGSIIQYAYAVSTTFVDRASTSWGELSTSYRVSITPLRSTSRLFIQMSFGYSIDTDHYTQTFKIYDVTNSADASVGAASGSRNRASGAMRGQYNNDNACFLTLNAAIGASTTVARTYGLYQMGYGTCRVLQSWNDRSDPWGWTCPWTATILEIAQ